MTRSDEQFQLQREIEIHDRDGRGKNVYNWSNDKDLSFPEYLNLTRLSKGRGGFEWSSGLIACVQQREQSTYRLRHSVALMIIMSEGENQKQQRKYEQWMKDQLYDKC